MPSHALTRDGTEYRPEYLMAIDAGRCIGCGRCFKVCGRGMMTLHGMTEDGALVLPGTEAWDDVEDEIVRKVMALVAPRACIGCGACGRVCPSGCQRHAADG